MGQCNTGACARVHHGFSNAMPSVTEVVPHDCAPRCKEGFVNTLRCADECVERDLYPAMHDDGLSGDKFRLLHDEVVPEKWGMSDWKMSGATLLQQDKALSDKGVSFFDPNRIQDLYDLDDENSLGAGSYGVVVKGFCKAESLSRAVKMIPKVDSKQVAWAKDEIDILHRAEHQNIISLVQSFEDDANIYLVMDLCEGGAIGERLHDGGHFTELQSLVISKQILLAVKYLHEISICHRDLKPDNFLLETKSPLETGVVKLIDFGMSCEFRRGQFMTRNVGTPFFVAPEVLKSRYTEACDLWSCGVMLFLFLCGSYPFHGDTIEELWQKVRLGNYKMHGTIWDSVSDGSKTLVRGLLKHQYEQRLTAAGALATQAIIKRTPAVQWV